jgi:hypothetical protein
MVDTKLSTVVASSIILGASVVLFLFQDNTQDLLHSHRPFLRALFLYLQNQKLDVSDSP